MPSRPDGDMQSEFETSFPYTGNRRPASLDSLKLKRIWKKNDQWIGFFVVMLVMVKQKWQFVRPLKLLRMENKLRF